MNTVMAQALPIFSYRLAKTWKITKAMIKMNRGEQEQPNDPYRQVSQNRVSGLQTELF